MMCQGAYVGVVQLAEEFDFVLELLEFGVLHLGLIESLDGHIDAAPEPSAERSGFMLALPYGGMSRQLARARIKPVDFGKVASGQRLHDLEVVVVDAPVVRQPGTIKTRENSSNSTSTEYVAAADRAEVSGEGVYVSSGRVDELLPNLVPAYPASA
jgi:hypothetical protein